MKHLSQFLSFDWQAFANGKKFLVTGVSPWKDYDTGKALGTRVEVVIVSDKTAYRQREGEHVTNRFEKLVFKTSKTVSPAVESYISPVGVEAKVWGDYRNNLSVTCADVREAPKA